MQMYYKDYLNEQSTPTGHLTAKWSRRNNAQQNVTATEWMDVGESHGFPQPHRSTISANGVEYGVLEEDRNKAQTEANPETPNPLIDLGPVDWKIDIMGI